MKTPRPPRRLQAVYDAVTPLIHRLDVFLRYLLAVGMFVIMTAVIFHVCGRYFFGLTYMGTMELVRYTVVWVSMIGTACAFGARDHVCINFLQSRISRRKWFWLHLLGDLMLIAFVVVMIKGGVTISLRNWHQTSLGMQIPMLWPYLAIPLGGLIILPYLFHDLLGRTIDYLSGKGGAT